MSTQPLQMAQDVVRQVMANVTPEQMSAATPCASWDVAGLINHLVGGNQFFAAGMRGQAPSADETNWAEGDWRASYDAQANEALAAFGEEGALERMVELPFGTMPGAAFMGLAMTDTFQHAWDLAKATGQDTNLAPEMAQQLLAQCKQSIQDEFRGPEGAPFGAQVECADDACAADQLAAFLGRQV